MTDCNLISVEVADSPTGILTVETLSSNTPLLEVSLQATTALIEITLANPSLAAGGDGDGDGDGDETLTNVSLVESIAAGATLGLQQELLAQGGQAAKTVLAVGATNTGKVQGVSLGDGNVVEVFASGADFEAGLVLYREFMNLGEPICFTDLADGAIIVATQGFYGVSEQINDADGEYGPMPLFSYGLSFDFSFLYGFRDFAANEGLIHVINGPLANTISLTLGDGSVVGGQQDISLAPWEKTVLSGDGEQEYILRGTNRMMAGVQSRMLDPQIRDNRLVMPLTNDGITWPRRGFVSAPYENTLVDFYVRNGASGSLNSGLGVSPGQPVDISADPPTGTGADDNRYLPDGATRFRAKGLISAFSGADGFGKEASPMMPVTAMAQVTAQPFHIGDVGTGDDSGIAMASCYECEAEIFEYDPDTDTLVSKYTVSLTRNAVTIASPQDQFHPTAATISNDTALGAISLDGPLKPGIIVSTAPIMVITQNGDLSLQPSIRSQNNSTTTAIKTEADETLMLGWTPETVRAEIRRDANGFTRRRIIDGNGAQSWSQT